MLGRCHFGGREHARLRFHLLQPRQRHLTHAFKAPRFGARFPNTCPKNAAATSCQITGCDKHLLLGFGRTGACYHAHRLLAAAGQMKGS